MKGTGIARDEEFAGVYQRGESRKRERTGDYDEELAAGGGNSAYEFVFYALEVECGTEKHTVQILDRGELAEDFVLKLAREECIVAGGIGVEHSEGTAGGKSPLSEEGVSFFEGFGSYVNSGAREGAGRLPRKEGVRKGVDDAVSEKIEAVGEIRTFTSISSFQDLCNETGERDYRALCVVEDSTGEKSAEVENEVIAVLSYEGFECIDFLLLRDEAPVEDREDMGEGRIGADEGLGFCGADIIDSGLREEVAENLSGYLEDDGISEVYI